MRVALLISAGLGGFATMIGTADASPAVVQESSLQRCLASAADEAGFSGVLEISRAGRPVATIVRGRLAGEASASITPASRFNLGSASKMFTAVAVGQLIDSGRVRLDDPIGRFVDDLSAEASAVTVRQLLTHSSGLGNFFTPENMEAMLRARTAADLLPLIAADRPAFTPGSRFAYSNSGYALLGVLIERVSGSSYGDYLRAHVFAPAGMNHSSLDPRPLETLAVAMTARRPPAAGSGRMLVGPGGRPVEPSPAGTEAGLHPAPGATQGYGSPAGGLFSTSEDLRRFAEALLANRLTRPETTRALLSPQIVAVPATADRPARHYGFGFSVGEQLGHRWFGHNGGTLGANVEFTVFPEDRLAIAVLANRDPPMASDLFSLARDLLLDPAAASRCPQV